MKAKISATEEAEVGCEEATLAHAVLGLRGRCRLTDTRAPLLGTRRVEALQA